VSIVAVNYNSDKWLQNFLDSISKQNANIELIFVDNNSQSKAWKGLLSRCKFRIKIIEMPFNSGFGGACNAGVKQATGELIALINTDTYFDENFINRIYSDYSQSNWEIASPKILSYEGIDLFNGSYLSIDFFGYVGLGNSPFYAEGSALLISKNLFQILGGFDEDYFMYSEDIDLCWRGHLRGVRLKRLDHINIRHFSGGSSTRSAIGEGKKYIMPIWRRYEVEKNNLSNLIKCYSLQMLIFVVPTCLIGSLIEVCFYICLFKPSVGYQIFRAWGWNIFNLKKTIQKRKKIQNTRVVSDIEILKLMSGIFPNKIYALARAGLPKFK
jgi:GT2 family glycosyltransferase